MNELQLSMYIALSNPNYRKLEDLDPAFCDELQDAYEEGSISSEDFYMVVDHRLCKIQNTFS